MKFGTVSTGRYTGADRYTGVAVGRRSTVYDLLYVLHINFGHDKHDSGDTAH